MLYKVLLLTAVLSILVSSSAMASTVTLKGACATQSYIVNQTNSYIPFNISNEGNGVATGLLVLPVLGGATPAKNNSILSILTAYPGNTYHLNFYVTNFTVPGTYAEYFVTTYTQGSQNFVTIFPCLVNIEQKTQSLLSILNINATSSRLNVSIANIGTNPIQAQILAAGPPTFTITNQLRNVTVGAYTHTSMGFNITSPQYANSAFPVAVSASYMANGLHYATLGITTIAFGSIPGNTGTGSGTQISGFEIAVIAVIIILIALIAFSIARKRKHSHVHHEHKQEEQKQ